MINNPTLPKKTYIKPLKKRIGRLELSLQSNADEIKKISKITTTLKQENRMLELENKMLKNKAIDKNDNKSSKKDKEPKKDNRLTKKDKEPKKDNKALKKDKDNRLPKKNKPLKKS